MSENVSISARPVVRYEDRPKPASAFPPITPQSEIAFCDTRPNPKLCRRILGALAALKAKVFGKH